MEKMMRLPLAALIWSLGAVAVAGDFDGSALDLRTGRGDGVSRWRKCEAGILTMSVRRHSCDRFRQEGDVGPKRTSPIRAMEKDENQILLQGTELGLAWSMALNITNGRMVSTFSSRDGAFVLFGSCTPL
jgi:hypothetical protein